MQGAAPPPAFEPPKPDKPVEPPPATIDPKFEEASRAIFAAVADSHHAYERLVYLCDSFGVRLSGSPGLEKAIDWAVEEMNKDGLDNARREKVMVPHWVRGQESARMLAPHQRNLHVLGLGMSVGTRGRPIRGEAVVVRELEEIDELGDELKGKIVVINKAMAPYDHEHRDAHYGTTVQIRLHGATRAAKYGAKAVLIRSVTATSLASPHTGTLIYPEGEKKIPAAAIAIEEAERLERLYKRGEKLELELRMDAKTLPDAESANAIAELTGREKPDEIVLIGCHIDAWDVGDGAHDDGGPCMAVMEAARVLKALELIPRRTVRVVLFTNEENGGRGAEAYFEAHGKEKHVAALEADSGVFWPHGLGVGGAPEQLAELQKYAPLFAPVGADHIIEGYGGADIRLLMENGVLGLNLAVAGDHYFDYHHSSGDTIDKVDPNAVSANAGVIALMAYILAERE